MTHHSSYLTMTGVGIEALTNRNGFVTIFVDGQIVWRNWK